MGSKIAHLGDACRLARGQSSSVGKQYGSMGHAVAAEQKEAIYGDDDRRGGAGRPEGRGQGARPGTGGRGARAGRGGRRGPSMETAIGGSALAVLKDGLKGHAYVPGDAGYDEARAAWNLNAHQSPAVVVVAEGAADVLAAVRLARDEGRGVGVRATGPRA